jgi:hypothetical protein
MECYVVDRNGVWPKDKYRERVVWSARIRYLSAEAREVFNKDTAKQVRGAINKRTRQLGCGPLAISQRQEEGISN